MNVYCVSRNIPIQECSILILLILILPLYFADNTFRYAVNGNGIDANNQLLFFIDISYLILAADIEAY